MNRLRLELESSRPAAVAGSVGSLRKHTLGQEPISAAYRPVTRPGLLARLTTEWSDLSPGEDPPREAKEVLRRPGPLQTSIQNEG